MEKKTKNCLVKILSSLALFSVCAIVRVSALHVNIPEGTKVVDKNTIDDFLCEGDKSCIYTVTIPNSATKIDHHAFYGCNNLTSITIPDSVTKIGYAAFSDCSSLTNITIPNRVTSIGSWAFYGCSSLTNITIPDGVTFIGYAAFSDCNSLTHITIPNSVNFIDSGTFYGCNTLRQINYDGKAYFCAKDFYQAFDNNHSN